MTAALALPAAGNATTLYRWVDEDGVAQFSQYPPPGREAERMEARPPTPPDAPAGPQAGGPPIDAPGEAPGPGEAPEQPAGDGAGAMPPEVRARNCAAARRNVAGLEAAPRLQETAPDGSVRWVVGAEREARLEAARARVREYCD
jgi:hypothetical protein